MEKEKKALTSDLSSPDEGVLVLIEDYDPLKHRVKVKRASNGRPLETNRSTSIPIEQKKVYELQDKKVLKVGDDPNSPLVEATVNYSRLSGSNDYGFFSYKEGGNFIKGPVSLVCRPDEIRLSALSVLNPLITSGFPSTINTPIPVCLWSIPGVAALRPLLKSVLIASTLLAATGG
jgi:hypothetical protein